MKKGIKFLIAFAVVLQCAGASAQDDFYYSEIGVFGGLSGYEGDLGIDPTQNFQFSGGAIYRHKFDTRFAAHAAWQLTRLHKEQAEEKFINNTYNVFDLCGEFNFFDLERTVYRPFSHSYSTFIFAGPTALLHGYEGKQQISAGIAGGLGLKVILGSRFNLNIMLAQRLYFSDRLEGLSVFNNPRGLNGSNPFNNDMLTTLTIGITFNFWKRSCDCHY